jgi:hypothetical protein
MSLNTEALCAERKRLSGVEGEEMKNELKLRRKI